MNAKTHVRILKTLMLIGIIGLLLFVVLVSLNKTEGTILTIYFISLAVFVFLGYMFFLWMPVRCHKPGCDGKMNRTWIEETEYQSRLRYVCSDCGEIFDTDIINRLGEPW